LALELIEETRVVAREAERKRTTRLPGAEPRGSEWLSPSPRGDEPTKPRAANYALRRALTTGKDGEPPAIPLDDVTPHDLRRTAASGMASLGINRLVIGKVLNHVEVGVTAIYDCHSCHSEKRNALEAWAAHLERILSNKPKTDNAVPLTMAAETA
jgi:integrase